MSGYERTTAWTDTHRFAVDASAAVLFALVAVPLAAVTGAHSHENALVALALTIPLAWRRTAPVVSVAVVYAVGLVQVVVGAPVLLPADAAVLVALYSVTVHGPVWAHRTAAAAGVLGTTVAAWQLVRDDGLLRATVESAAGLAVFGAVVVLAVWAFALVRRSRVEQIAALRERAERLEVERDQQTRIATAAERTRIARELHDIVAHSLSVMVAQADGGRYAAPTDPGAAARSLETVAETGRAALADMRRLLGVLRSDDAPAPHRPGLLPVGSAPTGATRGAMPGTTPGVTPDGAPGSSLAGALDGPPAPPASAAPRAPQPGLGGLDALVAQVRDAGPRVSLVRVGTPRELPPGAGLTVFRVAQEALTNVLKHAGPRPAVTVVLRWDPHALVLDVQDDGRGAAADGPGDPDAGPGFGIVGMHERAAVFGGTVATGPRPGGGFRVHLELPTATVGSGAS